MAICKDWPMRCPRRRADQRRPMGQAHSMMRWSRIGTGRMTRRKKRKMRMKMSKPILCLDFDGVLHSYASGWQGAAVIPDPPVEGAIQFLYDALLHFRICIYSSRSHQEGGIEAMQNWIAKWEQVWIEEQAAAGKLLPRTSLLLNIDW